MLAAGPIGAFPARADDKSACGAMFVAVGPCGAEVPALILPSSRHPAIRTNTKPSFLLIRGKTSTLAKES